MSAIFDAVARLEKAHAALEEQIARCADRLSTVLVPDNDRSDETAANTPKETAPPCSSLAETILSTFVNDPEKVVEVVIGLTQVVLELPKLWTEAMERVRDNQPPATMGGGYL